MSIVRYWKNRQSEVNGTWCHEEDRETLRVGNHSFNLDHPVSPFVGDIEHAPVVMLMANGGYGTDTHKGFYDVPLYLDRVNDPAAADWTGISNYYETQKYWPLIKSKKLAILNACAYRSPKPEARSPKLSEERENQRMIHILPSCIFARKWMVETLIPASERGERLIVAKRCGQWGVPPKFWKRAGITRDPMQRGSSITSKPMADVEAFLRLRGL